MDRRAKLWWRIVAAALLVLAAGVNLFLGIVFFMTTPAGNLTCVPAHYEVVYEVDFPTAQGGAASKSDAAWADYVAKHQPEMLDDMIHILRRRVEGPNYAFEWRPLGDRRFEVLMPMANEEARQAKAAYLHALSEADARDISGDMMGQWIVASPANRPALLEKWNLNKVQIQLLDDLAKKHDAWANCRKRLDDPSDLSRLIRRRGVPEFRMAPYAPDAAEATSYRISKEQADEYIRKLTKEGPKAGRKRNDPYQWFPLHDDSERLSGVVTGEYGGHRYLLLTNDPNDTMLDPPGWSQWRLDYAYPTTDEMGKPAVGFMFDARGASRFGKLTDAHKKPEGGRVGDVMAVLLDDEVYSAPNIQSKITDSGIISGSFTRQEVMDMVDTFKAGSLPAGVNPEPVSVREVPQAPLRAAAARLIGICALPAAGALCLVLAMIGACGGRAMRCGLFALGAAAATAGAWAIVAAAPFCGPVPMKSLIINAAFAVVLFAAALIGRAGFASKK